MVFFHPNARESKGIVLLTMCMSPHIHSTFFQRMPDNDFSMPKLFLGTAVYALKKMVRKHQLAYVASFYRRYSYEFLESAHRMPNLSIQNRSMFLFGMCSCI